MQSLETDSVTAAFKRFGLECGDVLSHPPVMTCDAQAQAVGTSGTVAKNLFLKDKRNRYYLLCVAKDTVVGLKVLSIRLGLKKGELKQATEEELSQVLHIPAGSVTPVAVCQKDADRVLLLLDETLKGGPFLVHPMVNTQSLRISHDMLTSFLREAGRDSNWVDFSVGVKGELKIGPGNPPDLKHLTDAIPELKEKGVSTGVAAGAGSGKGASKSSISKTAPVQATSDAPQADSIDQVLDLMITKMNESMVKCGGATFTPSQASTLRKDMEVELSSFRNASYARGMQAAKGAFLAKLTREWD